MPPAGFEPTAPGFNEPSQYSALVQNMPDYLKPVIRTAYITGWRIKSEILTRQKHHVDLNACWLRLEPGEGKSSEGRNFRLIPELREVLAEQPERREAQERATGQIHSMAVSQRAESFRKAWTSACKRAGIAGKIPHDFRRTAVRNLERAGVRRVCAARRRSRVSIAESRQSVRSIRYRRTLAPRVSVFGNRSLSQLTQTVQIVLTRNGQIDQLAPVAAA